jgi:hypothetical protein
MLNIVSLVAVSMKRYRIFFFFACDLTYNVWCGILQWLGIQSALHDN